MQFSTQKNFNRKILLWSSARFDDDAIYRNKRKAKTYTVYK